MTRDKMNMSNIRTENCFTLFLDTYRANKVNMGMSEKVG